MSRLDEAYSRKLYPIGHIAPPALGLTVLDLLDPEHPINDSSLSGKKDGSIVNLGNGQLRVATGSNPTDRWYYMLQEHDVNPVPVRQKSELVWTGVNVVIPTSVTNLISLLKANVPNVGYFFPFFDTTLDKMVVFPEDETLHFKLVMTGIWAAGSNRSVELSFSGQVPDVLLASRNDAVTIDTLTFPTFFSVDANGFLANNGSTISIKANGGTFTASTIKLIAEQGTTNP